MHVPETQSLTRVKKTGFLNNPPADIDFKNFIVLFLFDNNLRRVQNFLISLEGRMGRAGSGLNKIM
jgi:hypothetical protein